MGFCSDDEYREFMRSCPLFEEMLIRSGVILVKYWFFVNDEEQEAQRATNSTFCAVGRTRAMLCSPSRRPTSRMITGGWALIGA